MKVILKRQFCGLHWSREENLSSRVDYMYEAKNYYLINYTFSKIISYKTRYLNMIP